MGRAGVVRRSPRHLDGPASENLPFRSLVRPGRPLCSRALQLGGRPGGEPRAARSERGEQRRRAPGGALSDPDWRHPEQRRTDLVGAGEPPAYAGVFWPTADDFGHRNGPPLISSSAGKREDIADRWSRRTGDERRAALGPHGIAHAHTSGRGHAAAQERRRGLRHGCGDSPAAPEAPHAVIVFTYDWLPVNTAVRGFPDTFLNVMDHPWTFQMMTRADCALSVLQVQAVRALEVMPSMSSIRSVVVCVATPASLVRGRLCWRSSASPRSFRL